MFCSEVHKMEFDGISRVVQPDEKIALHVLYIIKNLSLDIWLTPFVVYMLASSPNVLYLLNIWLHVKSKQLNHKQQKGQVSMQYCISCISEQNQHLLILQASNIFSVGLPTLTLQCFFLYFLAKIVI